MRVELALKSQFEGFTQSGKYELTIFAKIGKGRRINRKRSEYSDNINTDIFGSNLYNQYLSRIQMVTSKRAAALGARNIHHLLGGDPTESMQEAERCYSILVEVRPYAITL